MGTRKIHESAIRGDGWRMPPEKIFIVGRDKRTDGRIDGPEHPLWQDRATFDPHEDTVFSLMEGGLIEPVVVLEVGDYIELVAGRDRVISGREANRRRVEAGLEPMVFRVEVRRSLKDAIRVKASENAIRRDLTPLQKAREVERALNFGLTEAEAARAMGVDAGTLKRWLKLLSLDPAVQGALDEGQITQGAALALTEIDHHGQREILAQEVAKGEKKPTTARVLSAAAEKKKGAAPDKEKVPFDKRPPKRPDFRHLAMVNLDLSESLSLAHDFHVVRAMATWASTGNRQPLIDLDLWELIERSLETPREGTS